MGEMSQDMESAYTPNHIAIQKYLKGIDYPADKMTLIDHAKGNNAPDDIIMSLERLPEKEFRTPAERFLVNSLDGICD